MGLVADRVKETSATTGSSNITLLGAVAQFQSFTSAFGTGRRFYYAIIDGNNVDWETGEGYLSTSSSGVMIREAPMQSSNSGNLIALSANTHSVFSTISADLLEDFTGKIYCLSRGMSRL